ncbi:hypothetical protein G4B88_000304 [Cannabis sativa]|uniref:Uncharacterized protein n=1 Tax=Cannabis sativa TaxID=3483 RepID=A0A7J6DVD1_CANSA|nr:hypothetical protein G4B88_000304 [Cannabis sativa]
MAQNNINGTINIGATLKSGDKLFSSWLSSSGDFAFGFQQLPNNNKDLFLLAIWFNKLPEKTVVWYADTPNNPTPKGSKLELTTDRGLLLTDPQNQELWNSNPIISQVNMAIFNDSGNFVLVNKNSEKIWESFSHPTDTLLPTQVLEKGDVVSSRASLSTNFSKGRFQLSLGKDGNFVLNSINLPSEFTNDNYYIRSTDNTVIQRIPLREISFVFRSSGACGYNRICRLNVDKRPVCECPRGFSLLDVNDEYRGCKPNFLQSCEEDSKSLVESVYTFQEIKDIDWPTGDYEVLQPYDTEKCKETCLNDCMCAVAIFRNNTCWKKKLPLTNGRVDDNIEARAFIKVRKSDFPLENPSSSSMTRNRNVLIIVGSVLLECITQIIHCDIKPQNILLDESYNARIADFGLAKLLLINQSHTNTAIRGTKGYVAPEWFSNMPITVKVDVYSFGVLLLEIICCRRNVDIEISDEEEGILVYWAYDCYIEGRLDVLVGNDMEAIQDMKSFEMFLRVAIWCIQEDPSLRPSMKKVMLMLEGIVQVSAPPSPFLFGSNI